MLIFKQIFRDLSRNKVINLIVLLIITIAGLLLATSVNLLLVSSGGGEKLTETGKIGDAMIYISSSEKKDFEINRYFDNSNKISSFETTQTIVVEKNNLEFSANGKSFQSLSPSVTYMFSTLPKNLNVVIDKDNKQIKKISEGSIYIPYYFQKLYDIKQGDKLIINLSRDKFVFEVRGFFKDPSFGSSMMSIKRIMMNPNDYSKLKKLIDKKYLFNLSSVVFDNTYNSSHFEKDFTNNTGYIPTAVFSKELFSLSNFMDNGIIAALLLLISIIVVSIVILILLFLINALIRDENKNIGVMKAIGIPITTIKSLYLYKYIILSIIGGGIGFVLSLFITNLIILDYSKSIILPDISEILLYCLISEMVMVASIVFLMYIGMRKIKKYSPIEFLHDQIEKRNKNKNVLKIYRTKCKNIGTTLATNEVLSKRKQYIVLSTIFTLCIFILEIPLALNYTINKEGFIKNYSGISYGDMYVLNREIYDDNGFVNIEKTNRDFKELTDEFQNNNLSVELTKEYAGNALLISNSGTTQKNITFLISDNNFKESTFLVGNAPIEDDEIAVTTIISKQYNISIGDNIRLKLGDKETKCKVVGIFQSVYNGGQVVKLGDKFKKDYILSVKYIGNFTKKTNFSVYNLKKKFPKLTIYSAEEYLGNSVQSLTIAVNSAVIVIIIVDFIIILLLSYVFIVLFINREKNQIAVLKSIGSNSSLIRTWQGSRIIIVLLTSLCMGISLSIIFGSSFIQSALGNYGIAQINLDFDLVKSYIFVPVMFLTITILGILLGLIQINKINFESISD